MSTDFKLKKKALGIRFKAILMPMCSGRSLLIQHMNKSASGDKKDTIYIDIDARTGAKEVTDIKNVLLRDYQEYHNFRIVLITSNIKSIKEFNIDRNKCYYYYPSSMLSLVLMSNRELITKNQIFPNSTWDSWLKIPRFRSKSKSRKKSFNYSLSCERGLEQETSKKYQEYNSENKLTELYDEEIKQVCKSRDSIILIKKSKMYASFKELFDLISKDIYSN